jgi:hypothetical protein
VSTIPPIQVKIEVDDKGVITGLTTVKKGIQDVDDSVKTASTGMGNFTASLKKVAGALGATFAAAKVVDFAKDSVMAASNMAESMSKVQVVFGDTAGDVIAFSKTSADSMGMSSQAALEAAGTYGNLFQALGVNKTASQEMSVGLVQLAADLGSFNNMSTTDSLNALRSGLSGETEPLKRFGIALNDVTLKNKAMEMGFGKITGVMDPAIKAQVTYALVLEQTKLAQGDYARTADGTANTMKTLQAKFEDAKVAVGEALMPAFKALLGVLKIAIPVLTKIGEFFKNNQAEVKAFAITVGILGTAWAAYTVYVKAAIIQQKILNFVQKINPIGLIVIAVGLLVGAMVKLFNSNETFRKAVINMAKAALTAFASVVPMVANVAEAILKVVTGPLKALLTVLSKLPGVGKYAKAGLDLINKGVEGISDMGAKASAKATELIGKLDKISTVAKKAKADTDAVGKSNGTGKDETPKGTGKITAEEQKRLDKLKDYAKDVEDIYKDMNEVILESQEKMADAMANRDEKIADAHERALEQEADLRKNYKEAMEAADERYLEATAEAFDRHRKADAEATKRHAEAVAEATDRYRKADVEAQKRNTEAITEAKERYRKADIESNKRFAEEETKIKNDYVKKTLALEETLAKKTADLRESAAKKSLDLTEKAAEKQNGIIKQSIDRLRSAFASKTGIDIAESFEKGGSADKLLADLKAKLQGAKELQANAAALAGMGYSQTFIEEVVKNGPEAGNAIAKALKAASPEATAELQSLYGQVETISEHGLDALAQTMNSGGRLATQELMDAYSQVAINLQESLTKVDVELQKGLADANAAYADAMVEAKAVRDEKLSQAAEELTEALAKSKTALEEAILEADTLLKETLAKNKVQFDEAILEADKLLKESLAKNKTEFDEAIADADKALKKAQLQAQKNLEEGLAEVKKTLEKALIEAQKKFEKDIDDIEKATMKKLENLKAKLAEVAAAMTALGAAQAAAAAMINAPAVSATTPIVTPVTSTLYSSGGRIDSAGNYNAFNPDMVGMTAGGSKPTIVVDQTFNTTKVDPYDVKVATIAGIKFGTAVTIS